jgi:hypothetical protein
MLFIKCTYLFFIEHDQLLNTKVFSQARSVEGRAWVRGCGLDPFCYVSLLDVVSQFNCRK